MRILHLTHQGDLGGATNSITWLCRGLADRGHEVVLAYAFALVTYLLLEAAWLAVVSRGTVPGIGDR